MKKALLILLTALFTFACSAKEKGAKLETGTPEYILAETLAKKVPLYDPQKNMVLATTSAFDVTVGDVVAKFRVAFGKQIDNLEKQPAEKLKSLASEMAENVALTKMVILEAKKEGISVTEAHVDSVLQKQYATTGGEEKFKQYIEANGVTIDMVKSDLTDYEYIRQYMTKVTDERNQVTDAQIDSAQNTDRTASVRHILLLTKDKTDAEKAEIYKKMEGILKQARAGADFAELAKKYSEDPGSKNKGGLYENFPHGQMVPPFDSAAFSVPIGQISDIVETSYGYHILKIENRKKDDRPRDQIKKELESRNRAKITNQVYKELKDKYKFKLETIS